MPKLAIDLVLLENGEMLVPARALSGLVESIAAEVSGWPEQCTDQATTERVLEMLERVGDQIEMVCIEFASGIEPG